jgi:SRSO17 transposase
MDANAIVELRPRLARFLDGFDDCFGRPEPEAHLSTYIKGQLSDLPRKSIEPIALHFGTPPRTLQQFLSGAHWDEDRMRQRVQEQVAARYTHGKAVGIIDETSFPKKGTRTPGVKRQHCGATGKRDNCSVSVHLAYAAPHGFRVLLDGELFLPEDWSADRQRCRQAGIPDEMVYRPKWRIALELWDRAVASGVHLPWLTFDEEYGRIPEFHQQLDQRGQWYVAEVPCNFYGWCKRPQPLHKKHHRHGPGDLKVKSPPASRADDLARYSPAFKAQPWRKFYIKDSQKGPIVWEAKFATFYISDAGMPGRPHWLIVARNALDPDEVKYFVSNAPLNTRQEELLRVGFSRYAIERCFEDDKTEVGLDHFEVRNYPSLKRHLIISSLSLLFLAEIHRQDRGEKSGVDGLPGADGGQRDDPLPVDAGEQASGVSATSGAEHRLHAAKERRRPQESSQGGAPPASPSRHQNLLPTPMSP